MIENLLFENQEWLDTILKSIGDGVIVVDPDGNIRFMNNQAEIITGWEETEAIGTSLKKVEKLNR